MLHLFHLQCICALGCLSMAISLNLGTATHTEQVPNTSIQYKHCLLDIIIVKTQGTHIVIVINEYYYYLLHRLHKSIHASILHNFYKYKK